MGYRQKPKTMVMVTRYGYRWMAWLCLGVLILQVLVVGLGGELPILIVFLSIDGVGALIGLWIVKTGRRKSKPGEQQACPSSVPEGLEKPHFFLEYSESRPKERGICQDHTANLTRGERRASSGIRLELEIKKYNDDKKALELLHQAGFTPTESDRLTHLRRRYTAQEEERAAVELSRLKFARWLVETGKLTDQL